MISPHLHLTQLPSQTGRADRRNGVHVPDDKLPVHPRRADLCDLSRHARVRPQAGNRVLMNGEQLSLPGRSGSRRARSIGNTALRSVAESIEGSAVEAANRRRSTEARATAASGLAGLGLVKAPDKLPATLIAGEN